MNETACPITECAERLAELELLLGETRATAGRAADDVKKVENDVGHLDSEVRRLRAIMVGSADEESGGIRFVVQSMERKMDEAHKNQMATLWCLAALLVILAPENLIKIIQFASHWATKVLTP